MIWCKYNIIQILNELHFVHYSKLNWTMELCYIIWRNIQYIHIHTVQYWQHSQLNIKCTGNIAVLFEIDVWFLLLLCEEFNVNLFMPGLSPGVLQTVHEVSCSKTSEPQDKKRGIFNCTTEYPFMFTIHQLIRSLTPSCSRYNILYISYK